MNLRPAHWLRVLICVALLGLTVGLVVSLAKPVQLASAPELDVQAPAGGPASPDTRSAEPPALPQASDLPPAPETSLVPTGRTPNEAGQIMILMYHRFSAIPGEWNRTPDAFREDLETLYRQGYRLLSLRALLDGRITTPQGYTPVVLTFDDGWQSQFNYLTEGPEPEVDPDSAVGILLEFRRRHPDMGLAGTFYVNGDPFAQPALAQRKLAFLAAQGFELGNHGLTHLNLRQSSPEAAIRDLSGLVTHISSLLPGYRMDTLALPFGAMPRDARVAARGGEGASAYHHRAVLLVGANPAPSPYSAAFDPYRLPRVQASDAELGRWLDYFVRNPGRRFVSDGNPAEVTVPAEEAARLDPLRLARRRLVVVGENQSGRGEGTGDVEPAPAAQGQD